MSKRNLGEKIKLASYDDMFGMDETTISPVDQKIEGQIIDIPLDELHTFENHPFRVVDDESMQEMVDSISLYFSYSDISRWRHVRNESCSYLSYLA